MKIENLFTKDLNRDINGVVKADQLDNESVFIELDEYVITNELDRHFRSFFESYVPAVRNPNDPAIIGKIGVWVSGFFGSGKSHFIKILSYLLENKTVTKNGETRQALDFFKEKITDAFLIGEIQTAVRKDTDVILFNIDSRANTDDKEDAILKVFLKVFNERLGYCGDHPHIAHLERELDNRGQYETFQNKFAELTGSTWLEERDAFDFYRDELGQALSQATEQSEESTRQWVENLENNFALDIQNFCEWVKDYLDKSHQPMNGSQPTKSGTDGEGKNLLFLVDEVGQFIGQNTQMMLKLQTIIETLGTVCSGRAWVIVTSQADIDAVLGEMNASKSNDFSKIMGRFYTRIALSSSNTNEVIQKRLLEKNESAHEELNAIYAQKGDILKNQLTFDKNTTAELNSYNDNIEFIDNYPFVPYQYLLVQKVFESIRTKGATGKHLAMGERSLLDAFQTAAKQIKNSDTNVLIPFHCFYASIESFLEPAVKRTIDQACQKDSLTDFDNTILKNLFLIRYVDVVKSTLDNLVTLSIDKIDADKISLRKEIDESLNRLERQLLISRNGDEYVFLTNEEKEIENEIRHTEIEGSEETRELSNLIFDDILGRQNKYRYPVNKQDYEISRFCNGHPKDGSNLHDLIVKIISPIDVNYEEFTQQQCIDHSIDNNASGKQGAVVIRLGNNERIWKDLQTYLKTERFLRQNQGERPEQEHLLRDKALENNDRRKHIKIELENLLKEAAFYAIGNKLTPKANTVAGMLDDAFQYVIENTFAKLNLLKATSGDLMREIQSVVTADDLAQIGLDLNDEGANPLASKELEQYIGLMSDANRAIYVSGLISHFSHRPYGWPDNEILLLIVRLNLAGIISFTYQNSDLALKKSYDFLTSVRKQKEIRIQKLRKHNEQQIKKATKLVKELFHKTITGSGTGAASGSQEKELYLFVQQQFVSWKEKLNHFQSTAQAGQGNYPGLKEIQQGISLVSGILEQSNSFAMIEQLINQADALEDFAEDFEDLDDFYTSQLNTWKQLIQSLTIDFKLNQQALEKNEQAALALTKLQNIYQNPEPYGKINQINALIETVAAINKQLIQDKRSHAIERVEQRIANIKQLLNESQAPSDMSNQTLLPLQQCKARIEKQNSISHIFSEQNEAATLEDDAINLINGYIQEQQEKRKKQTPPPVISTKTDPEIIRDNPDEQKDKPAPYVKPIITINPSDVFADLNGRFIENDQDIDDYLERLKKTLKDAMKDGARIRIK